MTAFEELDTYIARDFNPDYWYDDAHRIARPMVARFTPSDWETLAKIWRLRPLPWQLRCSYSLMGTDASDSEGILMEMAGSADDDLATTSIGVLNSLRWEKRTPVIPLELNARFDQLSGANPIAANAIGFLRQKAQPAQ